LDPATRPLRRFLVEPIVLVPQVIYAVLFVTVATVGPGMGIPYYMFQLLAEHALRADPVESIFYLHAQPPLMNGVLAVVLAIEQAVGLPATTVLLVLHLCLGSVSVLAVSWLARELVRPLALRWVPPLALALHPYFYVSLMRYFYTVHEVFLLLVIAVSACWYRHSGRVRHLALACLAIACLVLTRSLFHPLWAVLTMLLIAFGGGGERRWRVLLPAATALALLVWPLKNAAVFGFFGYSSWLGYSLARGLPIDKPPLIKMFRFGSRPRNVQARDDAAELVPERFRHIAVLAEPTQQPGVPNLNHYAMVPLDRELRRAAVAALKARPGLIVDRAWEHYHRGYVRFAARNPYGGGMQVWRHGEWMRRWMLAAEWVTLRFAVVGTTAYGLVFPVALGFIVFRWHAAVRAHDGDRVIVTLMLFCVVWVLAMILGIDGLEGNRIRFGADPLLTLLLAWALSWRPPARGG
jgi:hypothetical protein